MSGLPSSRIRLIFQGKALVDSQKLGPDCKIQDENVVHMVEKPVPTESTGSSQQASSSGSPSTTSSSPLNNVGAFVYPTAAHASGIQGPNVVIRAVQFGFDPAGSLSPNPISPVVGQPQSAPAATATQAPGAGSAPSAAQGAAPAYYQQLMGFSNQLMAAASQMFQATPAAQGGPQGGPQMGSVPQNGPSTAPNGPRPAQGASGAAVPTHAHIQLVPQIILNTQTLQALSHQWSPFEAHVLPQFENHIRTLASDIIARDESFHATTLPTRVYEITVPRTMPMTTSPGANAELTLHSLWKRVVSIQRRWLNIIDAIEGEYPSFGTEENAQESRIASIPGPLIAARSTRDSDLPRLVLPILHPLRHLLEHWAPQVTMQLSFALSNLYPLLSQHHNHTHHRPAHAHPSGAAHTNAAQAPSPTTPSPSNSQTPSPADQSAHPTAAQQASTSNGPMPTFPLSNVGNQASNNAGAGAPPDLNNLFRGLQSGISQLLQTFDGLAANPLDAATTAEAAPQPTNSELSTPGSSANMPSGSGLQSTSNATDSTFSTETTDIDTETIETDRQPSSTSSRVGTTITEPVASSSSGQVQEDIMATWDDVVARDVERQRTLQDQSPFSHAYAQNTYQDSLISPNSTAPDRDLLEELLRTAEEAVPGSTTSGLPLSNTAIPPALLTSFQARLEHYIQVRLAEDPDWAILQQRTQAAQRFPNLHRIQSSKK